MYDDKYWIAFSVQQTFELLRERVSKAGSLPNPQLAIAYKDSVSA